MGMLKKSKFLLPILLLTQSATTHAADFFVHEVGGAAASSSEESAIYELIRIAVRGEPDHQVVENPSQAQFELRPRLVRLAGQYILSLEKIKAGRVIFANQMKTSGMNQMDQTVSRLVRSVIQESKTAAEAKVGEVTREDVQNQERKPARQGTSFGFGPAVTGNLGGEGIGYYFTGAYGWDVDQVLLKIMGDLALQGSAFWGMAGLGANVFLSSDAHAPFILGEFGYGAAGRDNGAEFGDEESAGFALGTGVGVQFLRTSTVNLEASLKLGMIFDANSEGSPQLMALRLSLFF